MGTGGKHLTRLYNQLGIKWPFSVLPVNEEETRDFRLNTRK